MDNLATPPLASPPPAPTSPRTVLPPQSCDAHAHMLGGADFPLWEGRVEGPAPGIDFDGWLNLYRRHLDTLGLARGVVVHSIFYGTDNAVTLASLARLGPNFRGVGLLPDGASEAEVTALAAAGVKAVRLNYVHGGVLSWEGAMQMAPMLAAHDMHIQMLLHADQHAAQLAADIRACPVPVVIDHLGWPSAGLDAQGAGIETLAQLLSEGHAYVKLSAPYRMTNAPYDAASALMARLIAANSERCLWGSDWPHLMLNGAGMPIAAQMLDHAAGLMTPDQIAQIFVDNPARLYGFEG